MVGDDVGGDVCECYDIKSFDCGRGHRSFCIICKIETNGNRKTFY